MSDEDFKDIAGNDEAMHRIAHTKPEAFRNLFVGHNMSKIGGQPKKYGIKVRPSSLLGSMMDALTVPQLDQLGDFAKDHPRITKAIQIGAAAALAVAIVAPFKPRNPRS